MQHKKHTKALRPRVKRLKNIAGSRQGIVPNESLPSYRFDTNGLSVIFIRLSVDCRVFYFLQDHGSVLWTGMRTVFILF